MVYMHFLIFTLKHSESMSKVLKNKKNISKCEINILNFSFLYEDIKISVNCLTMFSQNVPISSYGHTETGPFCCHFKDWRGQCLLLTRHVHVA